MNKIIFNPDIDIEKFLEEKEKSWFWVMMSFPIAFVIVGGVLLIAFFITK